MTREEAIEILNCDKLRKGYFSVNDILAIEILKQESKTGHWITTRTIMHDGEYYCDRCYCDSPNNKKWNYCPNCGAKMESEVEK